MSWVNEPMNNEQLHLTSSQAPLYCSFLSLRFYEVLGCYSEEVNQYWTPTNSSMFRKLFPSTKCPIPWTWTHVLLHLSPSASTLCSSLFRASSSLGRERVRLSHTQRFPVCEPWSSWRVRAGLTEPVDVFRRWADSSPLVVNSPQLLYQLFSLDTAQFLFVWGWGSQDLPILYMLCLFWVWASCILAASPCPPPLPPTDTRAHFSIVMERLYTGEEFCLFLSIFVGGGKAEL